MTTQNPIRRRFAGSIAALSIAAGAVALPAVLGSAPAHADYTLCAKTDRVAVRTAPDGTARDNLSQGQGFIVERGDSSDNYVYGYKRVNGVHGYVKRSSLESCG